MNEKELNDKRREALVSYLVKEMGVHHVRDFSESLRQLDICDLKDDTDLKKVTEDGLIDTLVVLFRFGTISKLLDVKKQIKGK